MRYVRGCLMLALVALSAAGCPKKDEQVPNRGNLDKRRAEEKQSLLGQKNAALDTYSRLQKAGATDQATTLFRIIMRDG